MIAFSGKKILIIVPHQDDEINIAGGLIFTLSKLNNDIHILYATNGDYIFSAERRMKECVKSCSILGVSNNSNIHYLGYGDQYSKEDLHLFNSTSIWTSKKGFNKTYGPAGIDEECFKLTGEHHTYNRDNFIDDIEAVIRNLRPDAIFAIDLDSHCDHRATSLATEEALGKILNTESGYEPLVYKSFAYPTAYYGLDDYNNTNIPSTKFVAEKFSFNNNMNPYYDYESRIRFPLEKRAINRVIWLNPIFRALNAYKTQVIIRKAFSIINSDQIFWQRRTDNLLNNSLVSVSSGRKEKLNDFLLFNCQNVLKGNICKPVLENFAWEPSDKKPTISIDFKNKKQVDVINIYNSVHSDKKINFKLYLDDKLYGSYRFDGEDVCRIDNINKECRTVRFVFIPSATSNISISELEIFEKKDSCIKYIAAVDNNDDFIYDSIIDDQFSFRVYAYNMQKSLYLDTNECRYYVNGKEVDFKNIIYRKLPNRAVIKVEYGKDKKVNCVFILRKNNAINRAASCLIHFSNEIYLNIKVLLQKINRRLFANRWR